MSPRRARDRDLRRLLLAALRGARRRAKALEESEARLRLFAENVDDAAAFLLDEHGLVRGWNSGAQRLNGLRAAEIEGRSFTAFYVAEDVAARVPERLLAEARERGVAEREAWHVRGDGARFWAHVAVRALRDDRGTLRGFAKLVRDDSQRKRTEQRLAAQLGVARALAESAEVADALPRVLAELGSALGFTTGAAWAPDGPRLRVCATWNAGPPEAERLVARLGALELAPGEGIAGRVWQSGGPSWVADLARESAFAPSREALEAGLRSVFAFPVIAGSEVAYVLQLLSPEPRDPEEALVQVVQSLGIQIGTFVDRLRAAEATREAERRRAEELERRVEERTRELVAVNRELEAFSSSVSHDLRAPLRAMDGFGEALLEEHAAALDAQGRDYLLRIRAASRRMGRLIDDLLALSRVSRTELERRDVDLSALVREVAAELREREPGRAVEVVVQDGVAACGDPRLLRVALENLIGNALKFTRRAPAARVEFSATGQPGGGTVYHVRDNGAGFDMAYGARLFQPFQRLHTSSEFEGTGIGLATLQRIVHRHGGRVWAEGAPGRGAAFHFTLGDA